MVAAGPRHSWQPPLVVAFGALYSRGMHLDGLADTADGLSAGYDAESSLRAMKASDTGPSGVAAVTLALLVEVVALGSLLPSGAGTGLACVAWLASRHTLALACRRGVPAAQPEGLGALVAGTVGRARSAARGGARRGGCHAPLMASAPPHRPSWQPAPLAGAAPGGSDCSWRAAASAASAVLVRPSPPAPGRDQRGRPRRRHRGRAQSLLAVGALAVGMAS